MYLFKLVVKQYSIVSTNNIGGGCVHLSGSHACLDQICGPCEVNVLIHAPHRELCAPRQITTQLMTFENVCTWAK